MDPDQQEMESEQQRLLSNVTQVQRIVGGVFGFGFACIGITLIGWLWLQPFGFMHPPLIFRIMGTFVALMFVAMGSSIGLAAVKGDPGKLMNRINQAGRRRHGGSNYVCPSCGAGLGESADVSPSGDVKCDYCNRWFNIHA